MIDKFSLAGMIGNGFSELGDFYTSNESSFAHLYDISLRLSFSLWWRMFLCKRDRRQREN